MGPVEFRQALSRTPNLDDSDATEADGVTELQSPEGYSVNCRKCKSSLCQLSDIRVYLNSFHLALNPAIHDKVELQERDKKDWAVGKLSLTDSLCTCGLLPESINIRNIIIEFLIAYVHWQ